MQPNLNLIKEAYAIVAGIPPEAISLGQWTTQEGPSLAEGTVCCPGTWLTKYPGFRERGLFDDGRGRPAYGEYRGYAALGAFFKIDTDMAKNLFRISDTPAWKKLSDKQIFLARMDAFLNRYEPRQ